MRIVAIACGLVLAGCVQPRDVSLVAHGVSKHAVQGRQSGKPYKEINPGGAVRVGLSDTWAVQAGGYRNSYGRGSAYAIADWSPLSWRHAGSCIRLTGGTFAGVATGYPGNSFAGVAPAVGLQGALHCGRFFARIRAAPAKRAKAIGTLEVGYKIFEF